MQNRINWARFYPANEQEKKYSAAIAAVGLLLAGISATSNHLSNAAKILYLFGLPLVGYGSGIAVSRMIENKGENTEESNKPTRPGK